MPRQAWFRRAPEELLDRLRSRRMTGLGPDKIFAEFKVELSEVGCQAKDLANWVYKYDEDRVTSAREKLGKIAELLDKSNVPIDQIGEVKSIKFSEWQGLTKDADGNAEVHDLSGMSIVLSPSWDEGPAWPVVQQCKPTVVRALPSKATSKKVSQDGWQTAVILPDTQIGFHRDLETGELVPFHDEKALTVSLQAIALLKPDVVVLLGDVLDLAEFSRFEQEPSFAFTTQASLDRTHLFLAEIRAQVPGAVIVYLEGNHDRRLQKSIINNAKASFGLRQAATTPETWPVMSVPFLLRLDDLAVEYKAGYPANIYWVNENLACIHGSKVRSSGSTAAAVIDDERVSTIFGHIHRMEFQSKTRRVFSEHSPGQLAAKHSFAASPGCLCRIDGVVPGVKGSTDPFGKPVPAVENWAQGFAVVTFEPGNGRFAYEPVAIYDGEAVLRGKVLAA